MTITTYSSSRDIFHHLTYFQTIENELGPPSIAVQDVPALPDHGGLGVVPGLHGQLHVEHCPALPAPTYLS